MNQKMQEIDKESMTEFVMQKSISELARDNTGNQTGDHLRDHSATTYVTSVIICAYTEKRWHDLVAAVGSLRQQSLLPDQVIVVIDHNPALFRRAQSELPDVWADVVVVENREEHGLSGARNSGLAVAHGEIIVFLDDDAVAEPNWLAELTRGYADPKVIGVGGASNPLWQVEKPTWFPEEFNWVVGCSYRGMPVTTATVRNLIGCNMSFRREVFEAVGGFRHGMGRVDTRPLGCEETELCIRATQLWPDRIMLFEPNALIQHRVPGTRASWGYFFARCYSEGLAKASVAKYVGAKDGLSSERSYATRTLPLGVLRGIRDATMRFDLAGLGRASAIVAGLGITTVGYVMGRLAATPLVNRTAATPVSS